MTSATTTFGQAPGPGRNAPLGSSWDGEGVNFALFSRHAERVELCLFDPGGTVETQRLTLPEYTDEVWHGHVAGLEPGQLYGYRVHGPHAPEAGHRFNARKLLVDPYARCLDRPFVWHDSWQDNDLDSAPFVPKCRVVADDPPVTGEPLRRPWEDTILYELHLRGFTRLHEAVPPERRGTFAALGDPRVVEHLNWLGITAVELLPVQAFASEPRLARQGLTNYWGYNPVAFFAPEPRYLADRRQEIRETVARLHDAGIEVLLDVVYNHTAEGDANGPILSLRGIDNRSYYQHGERGEYLNHTGCGNTLDLSHPRVLQLVMDSLRHWVTAYGIDGFRFDLAPTLCRTAHGIDPHAPFLAAIMQDPVLSQVKLIAEPWDLGPGGYRLGGFPPGWAEWNDRYRDAVRRFWRGDEGVRNDLAFRLTGSSDLFDRDGRRPTASVNYVTAHDGFTLADLVSYGAKHNQANGENNRDGTDRNYSANWGADGPTDDPAIRRNRARAQRNMLATLLLSSGVPMVLAGDETGRTQRGNNNAYCQDNELSWLDWASADRDLAGFVRAMIGLRTSHPALRRDRFFHGRGHGIHGEKDALWVDPSGRELTEADWRDGGDRSFGLRLTEARGRSLLVLFNAQPAAVRFTLPGVPVGRGWMRLLDTAAAPEVQTDGPISRAGEAYELAAFCLALFEDVAR